MNEAYLKSELRSRLRAALPGAVVYRHEDQFAVGMPDISVTRRGRVCWVEVKFKKLGRRSIPTALQENALRRLGGLLVTYRLDKDGTKGVLIERYRADGDPLLVDVEGQGRLFGHQRVVDAITAVLISIW